MKSILRLSVLLGFILFIPGISSFSQVGINTDGSPPNASAGLDVKFTDKGLLIPRVSLTSTTSNAPIGSGITTSLLIYNIASNTDVVPGYYYWNGTSWNRLATGGFTHYIGELFGGGIVVAVWKETGVEKGIIASLVDISPGSVWSNVGSDESGAQSTIDGQTNTNTIIAQTGHTTSAAKLCHDYTNADHGTGIFSDWYLPSILELNQCYNAALIVNKLLGESDGFQLNSSYYWSSTEYSPNGAWPLAFYPGANYSFINNKSNSNRVRAVRRFFYLGQSFGGGKIFFIDGTGQHGLIAADWDQSSGTWGCQGTSIPGTSTAIGTGQANTTAIVNGCSDIGIAAKICNDLDLNGYTDWFLASKEELNQMYLQKNAIGGFGGGAYWSSSESGAVNAWAQDFFNGNQGDIPKSNTFNVRAIRAF
jgi:Protein of unknown function (DUF1566)